MEHSKAAGVQSDSPGGSGDCDAARKRDDQMPSDTSGRLRVHL